MKRKNRARSPPTTRNIPELGISESIPLTEYFPFPELTPLSARLPTTNIRSAEGVQKQFCLLTQPREGRRHSCIKPQLRRAEGKQFLDELKRLLLRETVKEPDEGDLVGKAKPVMRVPALAKLHEIFLGQGGVPFELVAGKHYLCDTANAEIQKDASLAYTITRISLVP
jgi:hypothetical protein